VIHDAENNSFVVIPRRTEQAALQLFQSEGLVLQANTPLTIDAVRKELSSSEAGIKLLYAIHQKVTESVNNHLPDAPIELDSSPEINSAFVAWVKTETARRDVHVDLIPLGSYRPTSLPIVSDAENNAFIIVPERTKQAALQVLQASNPSLAVGDAEIQLFSSSQGMQLLDAINRQIAAVATPEVYVELKLLTGNYLPTSLPTFTDTYTSNTNSPTFIVIPESTAQAVLEVFNAEDLTLEPNKKLTLDALKTELLSSDKGIELFDEINRQLVNIKNNKALESTNLNESLKISDALSNWLREKALLSETSTDTPNQLNYIQPRSDAILTNMNATPSPMPTFSTQQYIKHLIHRYVDHIAVTSTYDPTQQDVT